MPNSEFLALILRRRWVLLGVFAATILVHAGILILEPGAFVAEAILRITPDNTGVPRGGGANRRELFDPVTTVVLDHLLEDERFSTRVLQALDEQGLSELEECWSPERVSLEALGHRETGFLRVTYTSAEEETAQPLLWAVVEAIQGLAQDHFGAGITRERERLSERMELVAAEIESLDGSLRELRDGAIRLPGSGGVAQQLGELTRSLEALAMKGVELEGSATGLRAELRGLGGAAWGGPAGGREEVLAILQGSPLLATVQEISIRLVKAELVVERLRGVLQEPHPDLQAAIQVVETEKRLLASLFEEGSPLNRRIHEASRLSTGERAAERRALLARLLAIENRLAGIAALQEEKGAQLRRLRESASSIHKLEEQRRAAVEARVSLDGKRRDLILISNLAPEVVRVFREPGPPRPRRAALGTYTSAVVVMAVLAALATVYFLDLLDHRIHDQHILRKRTSLPCLGIVPEVDPGDAIAAVPGRPCPGAESFHAILKKLLVALGDGDGGKVLLVTGPDPGAGKSFVAASLATCAGRLGHRTLLIDADLRNPSLHSAFQLRREPGLSELLREEERAGAGGHGRALERSFREARPLRLRPEDVPFLGHAAVGVIAPAGIAAGVVRPTAHENLSVATSGRAVSDPAAVLASPGFDEFLSEMRRRYSLVLIDSPPLSRVADALLLAEQVDGTLLVIAAGRTRGHDLHWVHQGLKDVAAPILGTVLNRLERRAAGYYSYYDGGKCYRARV